MTYVAIFGPPASGKTQIILDAIQNGIEAYDIESFGDTYEQRKIELKKVLKKKNFNYVIFGGADLHINDFPKGTITILLLPIKEEYIERLRIRDNEYPHKKGQDALNHYNNFFKDKYKFDFVFDETYSDKTLLNEILERTMNYIKL